MYTLKTLVRHGYKLALVVGCARRLGIPLTVPGQSMLASPCLILSISALSSSYVFTGTLRTKSSYVRVEPNRWLRPYSVLAALCSKCCRTSCCRDSGSVKWRSSLCCRGMNALRMMPVKLIGYSLILMKSVSCKITQNKRENCRFLVILTERMPNSWV